MIKVFKNEKDIYAKAYKNCDIIGVLRPHRDFWNNAYVEENLIEGFDIIYSAVTSNGYVGFPKDMPDIWKIMVEDKASDYANAHFKYVDISYNNFPMISITYDNFDFGAGAIQSYEIRHKICEILQNDSYYILITNEDQLMCIPTEIKGIEKEKLKEFVVTLAHKTKQTITENVYQYDKQTDQINKV